LWKAGRNLFTVMLQPPEGLPARTALKLTSLLSYQHHAPEEALKITGGHLSFALSSHGAVK
jgi:hypothetical protein